MIRRPPRSTRTDTTLSLHDALPISVDSLTATLEYTFSQNTVEVRNSNVGIWFNHNDTSSAWTDGPIAGPIFYSEAFGAGERKDLAYSGSLTANRSVNHSIAGNLTWEAPGGVTMELDYHHSKIGRAHV